MCRRHAGLEAAVVELEAPAALARERLARGGLTGRIHYEVGDFFAIELGTGYDVVTAAPGPLHPRGGPLCGGCCTALVAR